MTIKAPFQPAYGTGQLITTGAAAQTSLGLLSSGAPAAKQVMVTNLDATNIAHVRFGQTGMAAATTANAVPIPPRAQVVMSKGDGDDIIGHIAAAGAPQIHVVCGDGW